MTDYRQKKLSSEQNRTIDEFQRSLPEKPVGIIGLARKFGCRVFTAALPWNISGKIACEDGEFRIYMNESEPKERRRFTCAHELAHFLLHQEDIKQKPLYENILLRGTLSNEQEVEANKLAADILMPIQIVNALAETRKYNLRELAEKFGVQREAMLARLGIPDYRV